MIEVYWGSPLTFIVSPNGDIKKFTTIEQAYYWLLRKWPVADINRDRALERVDAAMHCLTAVDDARAAFIKAAKTAGFRPGDASIDETTAS